LRNISVVVEQIDVSRNRRAPRVPDTGGLVDADLHKLLPDATFTAWRKEGRPCARAASTANRVQVSGVINSVFVQIAPAMSVQLIDQKSNRSGVIR
jgi:hypothetical protein